ncbi:hypothetical protein BG006_006627 [Podila minutissima]|uniref:Prolyl endopeptidase-like n=1 Tax=Podila minutissima TaxID=64525 RepID=A0A9P5STN9_9FUNG|nr:hypothetical protein BG006_006627 [Podila minutissima]
MQIKALSPCPSFTPPSSSTSQKSSLSSPPTSFTTESSDGTQWAMTTKPKKVPRPQLPKPAKRIPRPITLHNETLIDNYRWMHQIDKDPDVRAYIDAEEKYTKAWIHYSGIERLQKQLEKEMHQIKKAMVSKSFLDDLDDDNDIESGHEGSTENPKKPPKQRLEGTQFWDIDRWRYWLDSTEGDYGIYKRRPIPHNGYLRAMEQKRAEYMPSPTFDYGLSSLHAHTSDEYIGGCSNGAQTAQGLYASDVPISVQVVLDVNHIVKEQKQHGGQGEFSFGSMEIQPRYTFLRRSIPSEEDGAVEGPKEPEYMFVAYTFDTSGDERYKVRITSIVDAPPDHGNIPNVDGSAYTMKECLITGSGSLGSALDNAGPETRWLKIGRSLYLYFTKLDSKGLPREVWRVLVESFDPNQDQERGFCCGEDELKPELVMREEDEKNVLALSQTNDHRYMLIESSGQTTSRTYFWTIGSPEKGWNLIRQSENNVVYKVEHHSGYFYLRTNHGDSVNFKVIRIPVALYDNSTSLATPLVSRNRQDHTSNIAELPLRGCFLNCMDDQTVIEHDPNEFLERFESFVEHFVAWVWRAGLQEIRIFHAPHPGDNDPEKWPLTELERLRPYDRNYNVATVMPGNIRDEEERLMRDFYNTRLRYSNCSFVHPWALYEYDMHSLTPMVLSRMDEDDREDKIRKATRLVCRDTFPMGVHYGKSKSSLASSPELMSSINDLSDINALLEKDKDPWKEQDKEIAKFKEMRLMVPSTHSTMNDTNTGEQVPILIPVSLVYYNFSDGNFPRAAFVKAYGAYGTMTSAMFEPEVDLPLLRRGLIIVQVHPRGDGVLGTQWYKDGKSVNKTNTFYDVEDVLLYLRDSGMVQPAGVVIEGRSAGGLISGWIANRWGENPIPKETMGNQHDRGQGNIVREMVKVVLAQVPFMDVIGDMTDKDVAWVEYEWAEWGNPLESVEVFEVMKQYSPYDRIRNQPYPAMMIMGGLSDSRVSYAEPLKFVAKLRSVDGKTNDCRPREGKEGGEGGPLEEEDLEDKREKEEMCAGKKDTALLLKMEDGGHFSGNSSLWMAFALHHLETTIVVTE